MHVYSSKNFRPMKKNKRILMLLPFLLFGGKAMAQLQDGSMAPDFTLSDINGNQHTLYDYLDQGKTVYIDFFACHCPYCWDYHGTHALADLYDMYGPGTASEDVMVMAIELDANNGTDQFYGIGGNTQGNWVAGTNYQQINPEGAERSSIIGSYAVNYYPLIYAICPDRKITVIGKKNTQLLYAHTSTCGPLGIEDSGAIAQPFSISQNAESIFVSIKDESFLHKGTVRLIDVTGKVVVSVTPEELQLMISTSSVGKGFYIVAMLQDQQVIYTTTFQKN